MVTRVSSRSDFRGRPARAVDARAPRSCRRVSHHSATIAGRRRWPPPPALEATDEAVQKAATPPCDADEPIFGPLARPGAPRRPRAASAEPGRGHAAVASAAARASRRQRRPPVRSSRHPRMRACGIASSDRLAAEPHARQKRRGHRLVGRRRALVRGARVGHISHPARADRHFDVAQRGPSALGTARRSTQTARKPR